MKALEIIAAFTLGGLALYFFVGRAQESSVFIDSLFKGYVNTVGAFTTVK